jgi:ABC-2 type transport system permease protein
MVTLALISMPIVNMITSGNTANSDSPNPIEKVYINNETTLPDMDFTGLLKDKALTHIAFEKMQESYDTVSERIQSKESTSVIMTVSDQDGSYSLTFVKSSEGPVGKGNLQQLGSAVAEQFDTYRINTLGITQEQVEMLNAPITSSVSMTDVNGVPIVKEDTSISGIEYGFIYGILFIILMVSTMSGSLIATSVVTEKSTRVIEYLLISVKPLALMIGKVFAMLVAVLLQMGSMVVLFFISNTITAKFLSDNGQSMLSQYLPDNIFANINIINIVLCFLLMLLGVIFYAILASLAGATVSRLEEIQEGLTLFTLTSIVGAYMGIGAAGTLMGSGESAYVTFALLFPLSSPFILPGALLIGKATLLIVALAAILQIIAILLLFKFVAKVFETLILHNGSTIKPKELIKIFKTVKEGK